MSDPKRIGFISQKLIDEIGAVLRERENDPKWQRRWAREREQERAAAEEKVLLCIQSCLRGNYGPKAQDFAQKWETEQITTEDAMRHIRRLRDAGEAERRGM